MQDKLIDANGSVNASWATFMGLVKHLSFDLPCPNLPQVNQLLEEWKNRADFFNMYFFSKLLKREQILKFGFTG